MKLPKSEIEDGKELLRSAGWLSRCPEPFREAVLSESQWLRVEQDLPIARGGDVVGGMYGLAQGMVGIIPAIAATDAGLIHIERAPFWFGLQPFVSGEGRQITALARSQCLVVHTSQALLTQIVARHPDGWRMLLMQVTALTALAIQSATDLLLADRHRRCGAVLLRLAGARNPGAAPHDIHCTHEELASMCNLSRTSISGVLKRFQEQHLVELGYRCIRLPDAERLRVIVDAC